MEKIDNPLTVEDFEFYGMMNELLLSYDMAADFMGYLFDTEREIVHCKV